MEFLFAIIAAGLIMGVLDFMWLRFGAKPLYQSEMPGVLLDKPNAAAAGLFYVTYVVGVVYFVVMPALENQSWLAALLNGAFFGLVAYATYGFTNLAVFKNFSAKAIGIDLVWGTILAALMSIGAFAAVNLLI